LRQKPLLFSHLGRSSWAEEIQGVSERAIAGERRRVLQAYPVHHTVAKMEFLRPRLGLRERCEVGSGRPDMLPDILNVIIWLIAGIAGGNAAGDLLKGVTI